MPQQPTPAEAIAILLFRWNAVRCPKKRREHLERLEELISKHDACLRSFRQRSIETLTEDDKAAVLEVFSDFTAALGPVGAAKALHLLASTFFPLWDDKIATTYGLARPSKAAPKKMPNAIGSSCRLSNGR